MRTRLHDLTNVLAKLTYVGCHCYWCTLKSASYEQDIRHTRLREEWFHPTPLPTANPSRTVLIANASPQTLKIIPMARQTFSNQHATPSAPGAATRPRITPTRVRNYPPKVPVTHTPIQPTHHFPRELYQDPAICHHCQNYCPQGDICTMDRIVGW